LNSLVKRIYSNKYMVKPEEIVGEIPSDKEIYKNAIEMS
jgi:hypothetical protein